MYVYFTLIKVYNMQNSLFRILNNVILFCQIFNSDINKFSWFKNIFLYLLAAISLSFLKKNIYSKQKLQLKI